MAWERLAGSRDACSLNEYKPVKCAEEEPFGSGSPRRRLETVDTKSQDVSTRWDRVAASPGIREDNEGEHRVTRV